MIILYSYVFWDRKSIAMVYFGIGTTYDLLNDQLRLSVTTHVYNYIRLLLPRFNFIPTRCDMYVNLKIFMQSLLLASSVVKQMRFTTLSVLGSRYHPFVKFQTKELMISTNDLKHAH